MAKNFPYFKFTVSEWMTGDIVFEDFATQGLFINICALYWQRDGNLTMMDIVKRYKNPKELNALKGKFIIQKGKKISIKFLDEQLIDANHISKINSINGSLGGRPKKSENKPTAFDSLNENKPTVNRNKANKNKNKNKKENVVVDWVVLLQQFNQITEKDCKVISDDVKSQIIERLTEGYSKQQFLDAITNCYNDKFHKESGHRYLTLEFISRPDKFEKFVNIKPKKIQKDKTGML